MNRRILIILMLAASLIFLGTINGAAQTPELITYQGKLTNSTGAPISSATDVIFSLYGAADSTAGTAIWAETLSVAPDNNGLFTVQLGQVHAVDRTIFDGARLWLGIKAGTDDEMTPRQPVNSAPYSFTTTGGGNINVGSPSLTGNLYLYTSGSESPAIHGYGNNYGGNILFNDEAGNPTGYLVSDPTGTGGYLAVYRDISATGFTVDGNYSSSGNPRVSITGASVAAYFNMNTTGNGTVALPTNAISAGEILDEPGIAQITSSDYVTISTSGVTNITSRAIDIPAAGYVVAIAVSNAQMYSSSGTIGNVILGIDTTGTSSTATYSVYGSGDESVTTGKYRWYTATATNTFYFSTAGSRTIYFNGSRGWTGGTVQMYNSKLMVFYYPTSYGTVTSLVSSDDAGNFHDAQAVHITDAVATGNEMPGDVYEVDLRELELKAAKARAEAEKAEKELYQAQLEKQMQESLKNANSAAQEK
jgi:hypothetical protein